MSSGYLAYCAVQYQNPGLSKEPVPVTAQIQTPTSRTVLTLTALGIVYGDIGTSPLYAVKETFNPVYGIPLIEENIIGGISAIFWSLMFIVSLKYVTLILRADNKGEGGILALLSLALSSLKERPWKRAWVTVLGMAGLSLFYGDAVITPAISVLSAVEGLQVGTSAFTPYVLPISVGVLIALFAVQRHGTAIVGAMFGPVVLLWFLSLAMVGVYRILQQPGILYALNPLNGILFVTSHGVSSFFVLGAVLLAFTGVEALYADMGHFGKGPVRLTWFAIVFPALAVNYMGQGATLIGSPAAIANPFFLAFPSWALYPMVALATATTVVAGQAMISGAFSLTRQAIQLGFLPRLNIVHTSVRIIGQVYVPFVNWLLFAAVIGAVAGFGSSSDLAAAYGVAVTGTMLVTTLLTFFVVTYLWKYNLVLCIGATSVFVLVDLAFLSASMVKIPHGGWFPLALGAGVLCVMMTWRRGRALLFARLRSLAIPLDAFLESLMREPPHRVQGAAVFLTATPEAVPHALLHNLNHNKVLHETIIFLTVVVREVPWVHPDDRAAVEPLGNGCWRIRLYFGFKEETDVPSAMVEAMRKEGVEMEMMRTSFFLSRERVVPMEGAGMAQWREHMFATMTKNISGVAEYFNIPSNRVIELGTQVEI